MPAVHRYCVDTLTGTGELVTHWLSAEPQSVVTVPG